MFFPKTFPRPKTLRTSASPHKISGRVEEVCLSENLPAPENFKVIMMLRLFSIIFWLLVILLGVVFAVANPQRVDLHYYLGSMQLRLAVVVLLSVWLGAILGIAFTFGQVLKLRYENRRLRKISEQAARELAAHTQLAVKE